MKGLDDRARRAEIIEKELAKVQQKTVQTEESMAMTATTNSQAEMMEMRKILREHANNEELDELFKKYGGPDG